MRNHNLEFQDSSTRLYAYEFDYLMHHYMIQTFQPWFGGNKALEMGCYKGEFTKRLAHYYHDITVLEAANDLIAMAKENVKETNATVSFIHQTFEQANLAQQFDAIFLIHTLEHLDDSIGILRKINSWLAPQGKLFLVVPNAYAVSRQIAVKMGLIETNNAVTEGERQHGHRKTYSFDLLESEARKASLNILTRGGIFFKSVANFQLDKMVQERIVDQAYLDACFALGMQYPELCASIYLVCGKG